MFRPGQHLWYLRLALANFLLVSILTGLLCFWCRLISFSNSLRQQHESVIQYPHQHASYPQAGTHVCLDAVYTNPLRWLSAWVHLYMIATSTANYTSTKSTCAHIDADLMQFESTQQLKSQATNSAAAAKDVVVAVVMCAETADWAGGAAEEVMARHPHSGAWWPICQSCLGILGNL